MKQFWRWGLVAQISLVILLSVLAYTGHMPAAVGWLRRYDWIGHGLLIGPIAFFLDGVLDHRPLVRGLAFPRLAPAAIAAVAGIEEFLQRYSPQRSSSWSDYVSDVIGIFFCAWLSKRVADAFGEARPPAGAASPS